MAKEILVNEQIRFKEVRVIGSDGSQLGIMEVHKALSMAGAGGLDLVLVSAKASPPVCKITDIGKYKYELMKKEKEAKKKQKVIEVKEVRISPNIDDNDLNTKISSARKFLERGDKVKLTIRFRGREVMYAGNSQALFDKVVKELADVAQIDKEARMEGKNMSLILAVKRDK